MSTTGNKADALYSQGNYTQAIQYYDRAFAVDPNDTYALNGKGNALDGIGRYFLQLNYFMDLHRIKIRMILVLHAVDRWQDDGWQD